MAKYESKFVRASKSKADTMELLTPTKAHISKEITSRRKWETCTYGLSGKLLSISKVFTAHLTDKKPSQAYIWSKGPNQSFENLISRRRNNSPKCQFRAHIGYKSFRPNPHWTRGANASIWNLLLPKGVVMHASNIRRIACKEAFSRPGWIGPCPC